MKVFADRSAQGMKMACSARGGVLAEHAIMDRIVHEFSGRIPAT